MDEQRAFGNFLKAERELRQISLGEVATATKVPLHTLESLEVGAWDQLPAEVFVRGFIKSYARHLGMPPEETCNRYTEVLAHQKECELVAEPVGESASEVGGRSRFGVALFVIILLIIATITLSLIWRGGASATPQASLSPSAPIDKIAPTSRPS